MYLYITETADKHIKITVYTVVTTYMYIYTIITHVNRKISIRKFIIVVKLYTCSTSTLYRLKYSKH